MSPGRRRQRYRDLLAVVLSCVIGLGLVPGVASAAPDERRALTVSPSSGPAGTGVTVRGTGWDPEYYSTGVRVGFYQNFGNGVLTSYAAEKSVKPDQESRFSFESTIPAGFADGDILTFSGLVGNGGDERTNFTVTGGGSSGGTGSAADLKPTPITYDLDKASQQLGTKIYFDSGIENGGGTATNGFNIKWFVDGKEVGAYGGHDGLPAGAKVLDGNSQFEWSFGQPGTYEVKFVVDADDLIQESDESNNATSVRVTAGFVCIRGPNGGCNGVADPIRNPLEFDQWQIDRLQELAICAPRYFGSLPAAGLGGPQGFALFLQAIGEDCAPLAVALGAAVFEGLIPCLQRYPVNVCTGLETYRPS